MKIRKQVFELTDADLAHSAVWEFCLDEEGEPGQDEATVRPRPEVTEIHDLGGTQIAKAEFTFSDGKKAVGYLYASREEEIPAVQPVVITPSGQVMFWFGVVPPEEARLAQSMAKLVSLSARPFPIRFFCVVPTENVSIAGVLDGFYHYDREHQIKIIRR